VNGLLHDRMRGASPAVPVAAPVSTSQDGGPSVAGSSAAVASLALRPLLCGPPRPVWELARFSQALYLAVGDRSVAAPDLPMIVVLGPDAVVVPGGIQPTADRFRWPTAPARGTVGGGRLVIGGSDLVVHRWWDPVPQLGSTTPAELRERAAWVACRLPTTADARAEPDLAASFEQVLDALVAGDDVAAAGTAASMLGLGAGLTPSGDDLLAGLLASIPPLAAALLPTGRAVDGVAGPTGAGAGLVPATRRLAVTLAGRAPGRTTTVSAELLRHAARGAVALPVLRLLRALSGHGAIEPATTELLAVGSSSGHDLCVGILGAVRALTGGPALQPIVHTLPRGT
jgi:hypothetical protein